VNFGVAPAILVYVWSLHQLRNLGWIVALGLAICCALRLARFNVAIDDPDKPAWKMNFFVGIPAPAGAGLAMAPMYLGFLGLVPDGKAAAALVLVWVALVAAGMVSRVPTFSGKTLGQRVHRDLVPPIIAAAVLTLIMLIAFTWEAVSIIAFTYVAFIPFGISSYRRQERAFAERVATPGDLPS
jgi:CDP-diacylglycerol---serine O-phosphatidyltransferase